MTDKQNQPVKESFADLFEQSLAKQEMKQGEVITAEVVRVDYNFVVVNAGLKSESFIPIEEFKNRVTSFPLLSKVLKTATATQFFPVTKPRDLLLG